MATRFYSSVATEKTIATTSLTALSTSITLLDKTGLPSVPFTLVLDPDTASEEIVTCTVNTSGTTYTITRGEEGTTAVSHAIGSKARHMVTARDITATQTHYDATVAHGATGAVVGTTNTQTLTNKTLTTPIINSPTVSTATLNNTTLTGTVALPTGVITSTMIADGTIVNGDINAAAAIDSTKIAGVTSPIQTQLNSLSASIATSTPSGVISMYGGATAPSGWLLCNGSAVSRTTYSALFTAISTSYGTGDGTTTFNVPDLRGRVPIGFGTSADAGITARTTLGVKVGAETLPAHTHSLSAHTHGDDHVHSGATGGQTADHSHTWSYTDRAGGVGDSVSGWDSSNEAIDATRTIGTSGASNDHAHYFTTNAKSTQGYGTNTGGPSNDTSGSTGTGTHGVMQPSIVVNFIIKT